MGAGIKVSPFRAPGFSSPFIFNSLLFIFLQMLTELEEGGEKRHKPTFHYTCASSTMGIWLAHLGSLDSALIQIKSTTDISDTVV